MGRLPILRTPAAQRDFDDVWFHIAIDNEPAATRTVNRIAHATDRLGDFPFSAQARPDLGDAIRGLSVGSYLILHKVEADRVLIVRIVHAARNLDDLAIG